MQSGLSPLQWCLQLHVRTAYRPALLMPTSMEPDAMYICASVPHTQSHHNFALQIMMSVLRWGSPLKGRVYIVILELSWLFHLFSGCDQTGTASLDERLEQCLTPMQFLKLLLCGHSLSRPRTCTSIAAIEYQA